MWRTRGEKFSPLRLCGFVGRQSHHLEETPSVRRRGPCVHFPTSSSLMSYSCVRETGVLCLIFSVESVREWPVLRHRVSFTLSILMVNVWDLLSYVLDRLFQVTFFHNRSCRCVPVTETRTNGYTSHRRTSSSSRNSNDGRRVSVTLSYIHNNPYNRDPHPKYKV